MKAGSGGHYVEVRLCVDDEGLGPCSRAVPPRSSVKSVSQKLAVGQFRTRTVGSSQKHSWLMLHIAP